MARNSQGVVQAGKGLRKPFLQHGAHGRVVHEIRGSSVGSGDHAASQVSLLQCWTEGMRKLLRSVSLSVSLLVLVSKGTEEVTGALGQLENRRSGSRPSEFSWFVCEHQPFLLIRKLLYFLGNSVTATADFQFAD